MSCLVVFTFPKGEACQARSGQEKSKAWSYLFRVFFHAWDWIIYIPVIRVLSEPLLVYLCYYYCRLCCYSMIPFAPLLVRTGAEWEEKARVS